MALLLGFHALAHGSTFGFVRTAGAWLKAILFASRRFADGDDEHRFFSSHDSPHFILEDDFLPSYFFSMAA